MIYTKINDIFKHLGQVFDKFQNNSLIPHIRSNILTKPFISPTKARPSLYTLKHVGKPSICPRTGQLPIQSLQTRRPNLPQVPKQLGLPSNPIKHVDQAFHKSQNSLVSHPIPSNTSAQPSISLIIGRPPIQSLQTHRPSLQ